MSVPAPVGADTNDERDEGGEGHGPLRSVAASDTRAYHRITRSSPPRRCPQMSRFASRIVLYRVCDASPQRVKNRAWEAAHTGFIPRDPRGPAALGSGPRERSNVLDQSQRQSAPAPT